ncbi:MAG: ribosome assembly RNA-binding protein YhbY [Polyangia bacterium]
MPTATDLSGKARRHLRALGHHLRPVVLVGKEGMSANVVEATRVALADHELIKVKLGENAEGSREDLAKTLATQSGASQIGLIGRVLLLYKQHPDAPKIELPVEKSKTKRAVAPARR